MAAETFPQFANRTGGLAHTAQATPMPPFKNHADHWAQTRADLLDAEYAREQAEQRHIEARQNEAAAWAQLEESAGRGGPKAANEMAYVGSPVRAR